MTQKSSDQKNDIGITELSDEELDKARGATLPPSPFIGKKGPNECVLPPGRQVEASKITKTLGRSR